MRITLAVAVAANGVIGAGNRLPWHLPADLRHFKAVTMGKPIVMGRRTWESIGRPLPGRRNVVVTRQTGYTANGAEVVHSLAEAIALCADAGELVVIGGAELYAQALPIAQRIELTRIHAEFEGDTFFPALDGAVWQEVAVEHHQADAKNPHAYSFVTLDRKTPESSKD
jgi:dihydrofolate reductase